MITFLHIMQIRTAQKDVLDDTRVGKLAVKIVQFVRESQPQSIASVSEDEAVARARVGIGLAMERGLDTDTGIGLFVTPMFTVGPRYYEEPECQAILGDPGMPPEASVRTMFSPAARIPWAELTERCKSREW